MTFQEVVAPDKWPYHLEDMGSFLSPLFEYSLVKS
jgi:hypothetical protein